MTVERYEEAEREFRAAIRLDSRLEELAHSGLGQVFMSELTAPKSAQSSR